MNTINKLIVIINLFKNILIYTSLLILTGFSFSSQAQNNPNGYNIFKYENGNTSSEGNMKNNKPIGYWKNYFENGKLKSEGNRKGFELDSIWKFYDKNGVLLNEITYKNGKKNGISKSYSLEGILLSNSFFIEDKKEGEELEFYKTGQKRKKTVYKKGKREGEGFEYAKDGRIIFLYEYKNNFLRSQRRINRLDNAGRKQGHWRFFHDNGKIKRVGNFVDDLENGIFREYNIKGELVSILEYEYGKVKADSYNFKAPDIRKEYYANGTIKLVGGYKNDQKHGLFSSYDDEGTLTNSLLYRDGVLMAEGKVNESGFFEGLWKHYYETGELLSEGEYKNGKRTKKWKFYFQSGKLAQVGIFVSGKQQGLWKWYYESGQMRRQESFYKGKEDGESVEYLQSGEIITQGEYISGYKNGEWFYKLNDHEEKGAYLDGERNGIWEYKYFDGTSAFIGEYVAGEPQGKHVYYYPSGKHKIVGKYSGGEKSGDWKLYDQFGNLLTIRYKNGEEVKIDGEKLKDNKN